MTVEEIKNILAMTGEVMEIIAKYFPADLNKELIELLSKVPKGSTPPKLESLFDTDVDYSAILKVLKGLDSLYETSPDIADFANGLKERNIVLKVIACVV